MNITSKMRSWRNMSEITNHTIMIDCGASIDDCVTTYLHIGVDDGICHDNSSCADMTGMGYGGIWVQYCDP